jgi:hypothetical protein
MGALICDFDAPLPGQLYWDASYPVHATYPAGRYHRAYYAFLPRDALHLTMMDQCGADAIVTTDDDFLLVDGLCLFTCNPHILSQG